MAETMTASVKPVTPGQIEDLVNKVRDAARKHSTSLDGDAFQRALGVDNIGMELFAPFRARVEAMGKIIVRRVKVDRNRSPLEAIQATKRAQYLNQDVVNTMPKGEGDEVDVHFVPTERYVSAAEVPAFLAQYGLVPDPRAQAAVNEEDPTFANEHPNGTQWGDNCCLTFFRWRGERYVDCYRFDDAWHDRWWLSGVPQVRP